uniref:AAA domain-containing protein n=1 Tax=Chromera velia CCMP2878 TaxID=1169474 RepID=A0A0G4GAN0_9ALVE|eukprot:Cvel_4429.t1-p1 / transcript=Cvel_4429.t1 / gene=Cvel_4429 / organism=Chromera_velia_CCMP2878 / gene_product=hypothetical protein / transcript_product=hypothetical protein / location=Cvel_scaffold193:9527-10636(-) / protein_length=370 / sequence_SO=supercontig / SO=protein_coding / is_pseudo=false
MPLIHSYAVWNNKGGVGKTTLTFHLACRYAEWHPNRRILCIDACPQASLSMTLLSSQAQHGSNHVATLSRTEVQRGGQPVANVARTIAGYLLSASTIGHALPAAEVENFLVQPHQYNNYIPPNLYLLCGDGSLELLSRRLEADREIRPSGLDNPWKRITLLLKDFLRDVTASNPTVDFVSFIDTNPAFNTYTEIAIAASTRLLCPIAPDDYSTAALKAMFELVYGHTQPHPIFDAYREYTFAVKAENHLTLPRVHKIILNRSTMYDTRVCNAFSQMGIQAATSCHAVFQTNPEYFEDAVGGAGADLSAFHGRFLENLADFHSVAVICSHVGRPLSQAQGTHTLVTDRVKVQLTQAQRYLAQLDTLVLSLD